MWSRISDPRAWLKLWPALPGALVLVFAWASFGGRVVDDAYISLVYARQLSLGHGLVFHPDLPRTEGYSNLLWTLLLALPIGLGLPGGPSAAVLGLLCSAAALGVVAHKLGGLRGMAVGLGIAGSPIFAYWAGGGLEGGLTALLLTTGVLCLGSPSSWIAFGLLGITRVEGVAWGGIALAFALASRTRPRARDLLAWLLPFAAQLAFRALYYGALVPSTVLAKVSPRRDAAIAKGLQWLMPVLGAEPLLCAGFGLGAAFLVYRALRARQATGPGLWAILAVLGTVCFAVVVGGDWMPNLRWLSPAVPLAWFVIGACLPEHWGLGVGLVGLLVGLHSNGVTQDILPMERSRSNINQTFRFGLQPAPMLPAQLYTLEALSPDDVVLMPDMGRLAWVTGNPVLDPQGLCWREVALAIHDMLLDKDGEAHIVAIRSTVQALRPALIGLTTRADHVASAGPVAVALLGVDGRSPQPWFASGWTEVSEGAYSKSGQIRYFLRRDVPSQVPPEQRLARYQDALARAPEAGVVAIRELGLLQALGRERDAEALAAHLDPRIQAPTNAWTR